MLIVKGDDFSIEAERADRRFVSRAVALAYLS
jgi:hypothetical protein